MCCLDSDSSKKKPGANRPDKKTTQDQIFLPLADVPRARAFHAFTTKKINRITSQWSSMVGSEPGGFCGLWAIHMLAHLSGKYLWRKKNKAGRKKSDNVQDGLGAEVAAGWVIDYGYTHILSFDRWQAHTRSGNKKRRFRGKGECLHLGRSQNTLSTSTKCQHLLN